MAITEEKALIKIASGTSGAQIRYTINGEDPTESDTLYTSSGVELDYGDVLRARAFKSGSMPSAVNVYKNRTPIISFEKVCDLDFLRDSTDSSHDSSDEVYKIKFVNNIYFLFGKNTYYNGATSTSENIIYYSSNLKDWVKMINPSTYYVYDIAYFKNKYYALASNYELLYSSNSGNTTTYFVTYDSLESDPSYVQISSSNFNNISSLSYHGWGSILATDKRLIIALTSKQSRSSSSSGSSPDWFVCLFTEDGKTFECTQLGSNSTTSSVSSCRLCNILYINGKFYANYSKYIYYSTDLINWYQAANLGYYSNCSHATPIYYYNGCLYSFYYGDSNSGFRFYKVLNELGEPTSISSNFVNGYEGYYQIVCSDDLIFVKSNGSTLSYSRNNSTFVKLNTTNNGLPSMSFQDLCFFMDNNATYIYGQESESNKWQIYKILS